MPVTRLWAETPQAPGLILNQVLAHHPENQMAHLLLNHVFILEGDWAGMRQAMERQLGLLIPPAAFGVGTLPDIAWHSFQIDTTKLPPLPGIVALDPMLRNLSSSSCALSGMGLVITVDTVLAHLAGALGLPTLLLLPFLPDRRWLLGREDSPW